ncbi:MAG: flavodoxin [Gaiellales bacterium]|nr:flavodoxin [Gaiellales bacterium]
MNTIGVFFGSSSYGTHIVAEKIQVALALDASAVHNIRLSRPEDLLGYTHLILGTSTWGEGDIQPDWNEFLPSLRALDLRGHHVALFGLGDQETYPETFASGLGRLYDAVQATGATVDGFWPLAGYSFEKSEAVRGERFVGLVIDKLNQAPLTNERVAAWAAQLQRCWALPANR